MYHHFLPTVLNMIGLAGASRWQAVRQSLMISTSIVGFDYQFNAHHIDENPNELYDALMAIYFFDPHNAKMNLLRLAIPDLLRIVRPSISRFFPFSSHLILSLLLSP